MIELRISRVHNSIVITVKQNGQYVDSAKFTLRELNDAAIYIRKVIKNMVRA